MSKDFKKDDIVINPLSGIILKITNKKTSKNSTITSYDYVVKISTAEEPGSISTFYPGSMFHNDCYLLKDSTDFVKRKFVTTIWRQIRNRELE